MLWVQRVLEELPTSQCELDHVTVVAVVRPDMALWHKVQLKFAVGICMHGQILAGRLDQLYKQLPYLTECE